MKPSNKQKEIDAKITEILRVRNILINLNSGKFTVAQIDTITNVLKGTDLDKSLEKLETISKSTPVLQMLVYN